MLINVRLNITTKMSQACIYPKYPEETMLFIVYTFTTWLRNFALV